MQYELIGDVPGARPRHVASKEIDSEIDEAFADTKVVAEGFEKEKEMS
jgi:hypothetical protein